MNLKVHQEVPDNLQPIVGLIWKMTWQELWQTPHQIHTIGAINFIADTLGNCRKPRLFTPINSQSAVSHKTHPQYHQLMIPSFRVGIASTQRTWAALTAPEPPPMSSLLSTAHVTSHAINTLAMYGGYLSRVVSCVYSACRTPGKSQFLGCFLIYRLKAVQTASNSPSSSSIRACN